MCDSAVKLLVLVAVLPPISATVTVRGWLPSAIPFSVADCTLMLHAPFAPIVVVRILPATFTVTVPPAALVLVPLMVSVLLASAILR